MSPRITPRYLAAFALLTILCGTSHEFVHHFTAAAICGCFGTKTFNSFTLCEGCEATRWSLLATAAGPLFTFGLTWLGAAWIQGSDPARRERGFSLIFANFVVNRLFFVLIGANDEQFIARRLFGQSTPAFVVTILLVWVIAVPPLVVAFRAMTVRRRAAWFTALFLLPFAFVVVFAGFFLENELLLKRRVLADEVLGIPLLIILVEVLSLIGYAWLRRALEEPRFVSGTGGRPQPAPAG